MSDAWAIWRRGCSRPRRVGLREWDCESGIAELAAFAEGVRRDLAAVQAAMTLRWSQGQTAGQINRLNLLKRQMYGRANLDLLRQRVRYRAAS
jgi:transposase